MAALSMGNLSLVCVLDRPPDPLSLVGCPPGFRVLLLPIVSANGVTHRRFSNGATLPPTARTGSAEDVMSPLSSPSASDYRTQEPKSPALRLRPGGLEGNSHSRSPGDQAEAYMIRHLCHNKAA